MPRIRHPHLHWTIVAAYACGVLLPLLTMLGHELSHRIATSPRLASTTSRTHAHHHDDGVHAHGAEQPHTHGPLLRLLLQTQGSGDDAPAEHPVPPPAPELDHHLGVITAPAGVAPGEDSAVRPRLCSWKAHLLSPPVPPPRISA